MLPRRTRARRSAPIATFVVFTAAGRRFALPTSRVVAVAEVPGLTALPAPGRPEVLGLVAHRGRALPLLDLGRCLDRRSGAERSPPDGPLCVVVGHGGRLAAFPVQDLDGLTRVCGPELPAGCETFDPARAIFGAGPEDAP